MDKPLSELESYLDITMKLLDLERQKSMYVNSPSHERAVYVYNIETEIKNAITKRDDAPHRSQDAIESDIEKYRAERSELEKIRVPIRGPKMSKDEWIHDADDSTGFWEWSANTRRLNTLTMIIAGLKEELIRD